MRWRKEENQTLLTRIFSANVAATEQWQRRHRDGLVERDTLNSGCAGTPSFLSNLW